MEQWSLAEYLLRTADMGDASDRTDFPEQAELREQFTGIVRLMMESREGFTDENIDALERIARKVDERLVREQFDEVITRQLLGGVKEMVERFERLSRFEATKPLTTAATIYLREAVRTYVFGFPQASVALSRAALARGIRDQLIAAPESAHLSGWIDQIATEYSIDDAVTQMAKRAASTGNNVMHNKPVTASESFDCLVSVRKFLGIIYSSTKASNDNP